MKQLFFWNLCMLRLIIESSAPHSRSLDEDNREKIDEIPKGDRAGARNPVSFTKSGLGAKIIPENRFLGLSVRGDRVPPVRIVRICQRYIN